MIGCLCVYVCMCISINGLQQINKIKLLSEAMINQSPNRKNNEVFQSRFFRNSQKRENPEALHTFFHNNPFEKYNKDISLLRPVSYEVPSQNLLNRNYVIVDQQVTYGKPLTLEQINQLRRIKKEEPEVVTWGLNQQKINDGHKVSTVVRNTIEVQKEAEPAGFCSCCAPSANPKDVQVKSL